MPVSCPLYWSASGAALLEAAASFISTSPLLPFDAAAAAGASALPSLLAWQTGDACTSVRKCKQVIDDMEDPGVPVKCTYSQEIVSLSRDAVLSKNAA